VSSTKKKRPTNVFYENIKISLPNLKQVKSINIKRLLFIEFHVNYLKYVIGITLRNCNLYLYGDNNPAFIRFMKYILINNNK